MTFGHNVSRCVVNHHLAADAAEVDGCITGRCTNANNYHSLASVTVRVSKYTM